MKARTFPVALLAAAALSTLALPAASPAGLAAQDHAHEEEGRPADSDVPLFDDLGDHHYPIGTDVPEAQRYFDQGLRLYYAFNHAEAVRSFREAQRLDPRCAMCWWGEALAWGPNINLPMDSASGAAAYDAIREALDRRPHASERERALIDALATRYEPGWSPDRRAALDSAYADAMGEVARRHPADDEVAVLHAEALMDLRPWDYWTDEGELIPGIAEAVERLEEVIERSPRHPGACHFFIHAVEEHRPEWAVPCAERLADLMPGAGHIVHMPGHIYIRVGRYVDAIEANEHAVHADETYIRDARPGVGMYTAGYYPHNFDFLAFAAAMAGAEERSLDAADRVAALVPDEMLGAPEMTFLQHWLTRQLQMRVRFARWDEILESRAPDRDLVHARLMWRYARGRALAATGDLDGAARELERLESGLEDPALDDLVLDFNEPEAVLAIAARVLEGRLAAARGDTERAVRALEDAAAREDRLTYGEPPEWSVPVRHDLGAVLLDAGRFEAAERVFRADLERFPENGWSLHGLAAALDGQGRHDAAAEVRERFREAWIGGGGEAPPGFPGG